MRRHTCPAHRRVWHWGATVYRYMREAAEVLAALAPLLPEAMKAIRAKAFVILDGTLLPIGRIAADTPYYSGTHKPAWA